MRTRRYGPGQSPNFAPGMCIIEPHLPYGDGTESNGRNFHPFIIIEVNKDNNSLTCVMARTLHDPTKLQRIPSTREIQNPYPPMSPSSEIRQYFDANQIMSVPIDFLLQSSRLELCNKDGTILPQQQIQTIQNQVQQQLKKPWVQIRQYQPPEQPAHTRPLPDTSFIHQTDTRQYQA